MDLKLGFILWGISSRLYTWTNKLATVVLYKDITAHVAVARISRKKEESSESAVVGDVTYHLVHSVNCFDLRNSADLATFASV